MARQAILTREDTPPTALVALLSEYVLDYLVTSPEVMREQIEHLITLSELPNVTIQIVRNNGRPAGTVAGYDYSKAFLRAMRDVVWDSDVLDEYLTDTQARAPGSHMYYAQPDAEIRRRIIEYLATTRAN